MREVAFIIFLVFGLSAFSEDIFGQQFYKWVDDKGTVNFSDNPTYVKPDQQKGQSRESGIEVLKRSEMGNRQTGAPGERIIINYSQGSGGGSGGSVAISSGRS